MTNDFARDLSDLLDRKVVDAEGDKIGTVQGVYVDDETAEPHWLAVATGWFGTNVSFVPFQDAYLGGDDVVVDVGKDVVKDAPNFDADGHLSREEESNLYEYYGLTSAGYGTADLSDAVSDRADAVAEGPGTRDEAMTRSEEEVDVSKRRVDTGRARLRKWIETEDVHMTVPIRREKARLVTEPITDRNIDDALSGEDLRESEHEVTLSEEVVDVDKRVVPKERVRLETDVETDEVAVDEEIRKERVDFENEQDPPRDR